MLGAGRAIVLTDGPVAGGNTLVAVDSLPNIPAITHSLSAGSAIPVHAVGTEKGAVGAVVASRAELALLAGPVVVLTGADAKLPGSASAVF